MQETKDETSYFFVDESGDPTYYDRKGNLIVGNPGCSKILLLGFVKTIDARPIRLALESLRKDVCNDPYLKTIPSVNKSTKIAFHAKNDCPEVRETVFQTLQSLNFSAQVVVGRKREKTFIRTFGASENRFYDTLVTKLFENVLHTSLVNRICFASRGNKNRQSHLELAIEEAVKKFETKWKTQVTTDRQILSQSPSGEPCLQVIDYVLWAVQRAYNKHEMIYFEKIRDKVKLIMDPYDTVNYPKNYYSSKNPFDIQKVSPL